MSMIFTYDGNKYKSRTPLNEFEGFMLASAASSAILSPLYYVSKYFSNSLEKEVQNNYLYKDAFEKSIVQSGLKDKGLNLIEAQTENVPAIYKEGKQAAYDLINKFVVINTDKISIAGFHELGHAMNNLMSKYGVKYLSKMRVPGYAIAVLMEYFAIFSRPKPQNAPKTFTDIVEDNCGKIAFAAMLPVVAEEAIASYRGIKLAKAAGLGKHLINNIKKLYSKALLTYASRAVLGALAVYSSRKIMDYFTRPKQIDKSEVVYF